MRRPQLSLSEDFIRPPEFNKIEQDGYARGFNVIAGLDEVGRGPLAGPVVAAAVVLPRGFEHAGIRDSKLLTAKQREEIAPIIKSRAISWAVGVVDVGAIDRLNILNASLRAMLKAARALEPAPEYLLIDGNQVIPPGWFSKGKAARNFLPQQRTVIKGDQLCLSIAAASIVAKVARDAIMVELDASYPGYGFAEHKGYACASHLEALRRYGPSPAHRQSFAPVREVTVKTHRSDFGPLFQAR
ncbi:MAG: ribonuclease HII [Deltaproteobacteria bacterium]|nr:ribonuclease HII [Deltaproteobacteria bacterium]